MFHWRWWHVSLAAFGLLWAAGPLAAQTQLDNGAREVNRLRTQAVPSYSVNSQVQSDLRNTRVRGLVGNVAQSSLPRRDYSDLGLSSPSVGKPFSSVTPTPTVSPYLNLFREDLGGNDDLNYQTLVRPQLDQQRINAQVQRQNMEIARHVQSLSAQRDYNPQGSESQYPTGHPTAFNNLGSFYPSSLGGRKRPVPTQQ
jgi:hypothetical protein